VSITRDDVAGAVRALRPMLERCDDDVLMVGTASSLLRGIDIEVHDVDLLCRHRAVVDVLCAAATDAGARCRIGPQWQQSPGFGQHFAEFDVDDVRLELSTIEPDAGSPLVVGECVGELPWRHFDVVELDGARVRIVASELRLLTEILRGRIDCAAAIHAHLASAGYDPDLLAVARAALPTELQPLMDLPTTA
jgi:hypothetical protein